MTTGQKTIQESVVMELSQIFNDYEIKQSLILKEVGIKSDATIANWKARGVRPQTIKPVIESLINKSKILTTANQDTNSLLETIELSGLRLSWVAKHLGISRQTLWASFQNELPEERAKQIQKLLIKTGREMLSRVKELKRGTVH